MPKKIERNITVIDDKTVAILKSKSAAERIEIGFNLWISARNMLANVIHEQHPELSHQEIEKIVTKRFRSGSV